MRAMPLAVTLLFSMGHLGSAAEPRVVDGWQAVREPAPSFEVRSLGGQTLRLADLAGRVVVADFWATWCTPCVHELPALAAYQGRLAGRTDVTFLSMNVGEESATVLAFLRKRGFDFPVYAGEGLIEPYGLSAFPTKLILDLRALTPAGSGIVRFRREGLTPVGSIEGRVAALLAEKP